MNTIKTLYQKYKELINYLIVGGLTTVVSLGVYYGWCTDIPEPGGTGAAAGGECAVLDRGSDVCVFYEPEVCV